MELSVWLSGAALCFSLVAFVRSLVPPQQRKVAELALSVGDLKAEVEGWVSRLTRTARQENVALAREVKAEKRSLREQAEAVLAERAAPAQPSLLPAPGGDETAQLIELRKRAGIH